MKQIQSCIAVILLVLTSVASAQPAATAIIKENTGKRTRSSSGDSVVLEVRHGLGVEADVEFTVKETGRSYTFRLKPNESATPSFIVPFGTRLTFLNATVTAVTGADDSSPKKKGGPFSGLFGKKDKPADSSNGSEDVRQALLEAQKKQVAETLKGDWVVQSGKRGIGQVDAMGCFGVNGERVQYKYTFNGNGEGQFVDTEQNKVNRAGERTSYTMKRRMVYTISGNTINVTLGPCKLESGKTGTWALPNNFSHMTFTLSNGILDDGAGWKFKKLSGNSLSPAP